MNYYNMSASQQFFVFIFPDFPLNFCFKVFFSLSLNEKSICFFLIIGRKFDIKIIFYELFLECLKHKKV